MKLAVGGEDRVLADLLDEALTAFNAKATGADNGRELSVRVTAGSVDTESHGSVGGEEVLLGGLTGWTWGDACEIHMLWIREDLRASGLGTRLVRAAEEEARRRGCRHLQVSSYTFQAPDFYKRLGFVETGRTPGVPGGHEDVHLYKRLD
ncbi:GNAT family N-acetyltransferase [Streptomyces sp. MUM 203J]|uniref:GNAT family N-acetyltransferase n=1 Tax=Streptomyces sp. MUM 203J TaxID=2791990 RepID=UPI001F03D7FB|nr:GNAT family N-acetyltransferase [Streptomyces sp. MUM 203J]MCH0541922.1 GNAT family N-acetyltransferase [Streptomyces sp. MUM 203J]